MSNTRVNTFGDLDDFQPKQRSEPKPLDTAAIDAIAAKNNFPSRTGRSQTEKTLHPTTGLTIVERPRKRRKSPEVMIQINIRAKQVVGERFYRLVNKQDTDMGTFLDMLLDKFEEKI